MHIEPGDPLYEAMAKRGASGLYCIKAANDWIDSLTDEQADAVDILPLDDRLVLMSYHLTGMAIDFDLIHKAAELDENPQLAAKPVVPKIDPEQPQEPKPRSKPNNSTMLRKVQPHTLTAEQWNLTLDHFDHRCAYCREPLVEYYAKDHFIPVVDPSCPGMVMGNIVPACYKCNSEKRNYPPQTWLIDRFGLDYANEVLSDIYAFFRLYLPSNQEQGR